MYIAVFLFSHINQHFHHLLQKYIFLVFYTQILTADNPALGSTNFYIELPSSGNFLYAFSQFYFRHRLIALMFNDGSSYYSIAMHLGNGIWEEQLLPPPSKNLFQITAIIDRSNFFYSRNNKISKSMLGNMLTIQTA